MFLFFLYYLKDI